MLDNSLNLPPELLPKANEADDIDRFLDMMVSGVITMVLFPFAVIVDGVGIMQGKLGFECLRSLISGKKIEV